MAWAAVVFCSTDVMHAAETGGDATRGQQKSGPCTECHGVGGRSTDPAIPKLAGQLAGYIISATIEFQEGIRSNPDMDDVMSELQDPHDLADIAAYYSSQSVMKGEPTGSDLAREGEALLTTKRCTFCHFIGGKRHSPFDLNPPPPVMTGQHKAYLIKAINDIRDEKRPGDEYGMMLEDLRSLSEREIEAIAEYLSGL